MSKNRFLEQPIGTKFAPPYACNFMDNVEKEFPKADDTKP